MERVQLVDQLRIPGTSVDAAHIVGKSSKRRVSRCPTAFAIPKCDRGVVETLQPCFGSLRALFVMLIREVGAMKCDLRGDRCVRTGRRDCNRTLEQNSWIKGAVRMAEAGVSTEVLERPRRC